MSLVATLISDPLHRAVTPPLANSVAERLGASRLDWLAEAVACDIALPAATDAATAREALRAALAGQAVDAVVQPAAGRRKALLLADMDSTMIDQECIDELADAIGIKARVAEITARAMRGEIAFEPALRERVALLAGLETTVVERVIAERITLARGGRELVATMNTAGAFTALVSGGFDVFTGPVAGRLGFREHRANRLIEEAGRLTGHVAEPILGRAAKAATLDELAARLGIAAEAVLAVGDGANDLDMIRMAGAGVALHAKPAVAEAAPFRIDHGDLTALLYMQGYRRDEFAA
ncbi:phosphoserine phosphatase SerB [Aquibium sp. A9E412]|uniref:phosphoserine phosphatase SerB n=1 Tax=Aquibium sp. A9E412 TaxID=2976767 RepID=UPI0025AFC45A|nr:phosphoserine phosphatase SerB [Aquibium sp. A9E412]MDN2566149.1 phosphoserine phosphatase SerB [Aquibium sp. A9E412]